jgi:hypothetical protein
VTHIILFPFSKKSVAVRITPTLYILAMHHFGSNIPYFLAKINEICTSNYELSDSDMLLIRRETIGVSVLKFTYKNQPMMFIDAGGQEHARLEREEQFHDLKCVFYIFALDDFDVPFLTALTNPDKEVTRLQENIRQYKLSCSNEKLKNVPFAVLLNKSDRFKEIMFGPVADVTAACLKYFPGIVLPPANPQHSIYDVAISWITDHIKSCYKRKGRLSIPLTLIYSAVSLILYFVL